MSEPVAANGPLVVVRNPYASHGRPQSGSSINTTGTSSASIISEGATRVTTTNTTAASAPSHARNRRQPQHQQQQRQQIKKRMQQFIILRDSKRQQLAELFDQQQALQHEIRQLQQQEQETKQSMGEIEQELMNLDNDIEVLSEQQHQLPSAMPESSSSSSLPQEEEEIPLTMHPDEHLPEPFTASPIKPSQREDEFLTDPAMTAATQTQQPWEKTQLRMSSQPLPPEYAEVDSNDEEAFYNEQEEDDEYYVVPQHPNTATAAGITTATKLPALDITTTTSTGTKRQRIDPPRGQQATAASVGTLDQYFMTNPPPPNNRKRLSSSGNTAATADLTTFDEDADGPSPLPRVRLSAGVASQRTTPPPAASSTSNFYPFSQQQVYDLLRKTFRIQNFRDHQESIIESTLQGQDVFVIMRTGGGKSLTYQLPALLEGRIPPHSNPSGVPLAKITFVISPLLSLIHDQEEQMNAFMPNSALSFTSNLKGGNAEHARRWQRVRDPQQGVCLVFVTPEKVHQSGKFKSELQKLYDQDRLGRIVIDECHCATQWGHDFRPDYAQLGVLKAYLPQVPILAVTATASQNVRDDCIKILGMHPTRHAFYRSTANRPNLTYQVRVKDDSTSSTKRGGTVMDDMAAFIKGNHAHGAGIVYTYSKKDADTVADQLGARGIVARSYHSDVSATNKELIHRSWMNNHTQVVVATIAFGLGINKPDVRFVLHHTLSKTLEAYYQESGRAGRDGNPADCILYFSPKDVPRMIRMIHGKPGDKLFWRMVEYAQAFGNDAVCRAIILDALGEPNCANYKQVLAQNTDNVIIRDLVQHAKTVLQLLRIKTKQEHLNMTLNMLIKEWRAKPDTAPQCVQNNPPSKDLSVSECERIIIALLEGGIIDIDVKWTAYDAVVYLVCTQKTQMFCDSNRAVFNLRVPRKRDEEVSTRGTATTTLARKSIPHANAGGWIDKKVSTRKKAPAKKRTTTKKQAGSKAATTKKRASTGKASGPKKRASTSKTTRAKSTSASKKQPANQFKNIPANGIIELDDSSDSGADEVPSQRKEPPPRRSKKVASYAEVPDGEEDVFWDDDSENEF